MNVQESDYLSSCQTISADQRSKPQESYVELIARAILSSPHQQMLLIDIYEWIINEYSYYSRLQNKAWRNSIRHNLSLNECFIRQQKSEMVEVLIGEYIQRQSMPFIRGDFRRRQARLRAKHANNPSIQPIPWLLNTDIPFDYSLHSPQTYHCSY